jgi:hypothetical protein
LGGEQRSMIHKSATMAGMVDARLAEDTCRRFGCAVAKEHVENQLIDIMHLLPRLTRQLFQTLKLRGITSDSPSSGSLLKGARQGV